MRILIANVHFWPDSFGGATIVAERTARELVDMGHEVALVCTTPAASAREGEMTRYAWDGIPVISVAVDPGEPGGGYSNPTFADAFETILRTWTPDVIHFHAVQMLGVEAVERATASGFPVVVTLHDAWWLCERQFMVRSSGVWCGQEGIRAVVCASCVPDRVAHERRQARSVGILNAVSRVLAPSEYWRSLMERSGLRSDLLGVNANGVVLPRDGWRRSAHSGPLRFGFVGGVGPLKGSRMVVDALNLLERSDYELRVVDNTQNLGLADGDLGYWRVPGEVHLVGAYTQDGLDDFFGSIDVLLFPSQAPESFGLTVREALVRGVWPIATDLGGVAEAITPGANGSLISLDGGAQELAGAIEWVLEHRQLLGRHTPPGAMTFRDQAIDLEGQYEGVVSAKKEHQHG